MMNSEILLCSTRSAERWSQRPMALATVAGYGSARAAQRAPPGAEPCSVWCAMPVREHSPWRPPHLRANETGGLVQFQLTSLVDLRHLVPCWQ